MKNAIYTMSGVNPKVPVFSITASGLNNWALGGYSPSYRQQGAGMAVQAINIEQGKDAEIEFIPNQYLFDFNKVKELGIPLNKIPENSELLNKEQPLWIKYPVEFISGVVALAIYSLHSFVLYTSISVQKKLRNISKSRKRNVHS